MAPRNQISHLQLLALHQFVPLVRHLVDAKATKVVELSWTISGSEEAACLYRKTAIEKFAQDMKTFIFEIIPLALVEDVVDQILLGVKCAADAKQMVRLPGRFHAG